MQCRRNGHSRPEPPIDRALALAGSQVDLQPRRLERQLQQGQAKPSSTPVSGPAAGLAVLVFELVRQHGMAMLGPILLLAGLLQLLAGRLRLGCWFRVTAPAVVYGMLAGIGVLIVLSQVHVMFDSAPQPSGVQNLLGFPATVAAALPLESAGNGWQAGAWALGPSP